MENAFAFARALSVSRRQRPTSFDSADFGEAFHQPLGGVVPESQDAISNHRCYVYCALLNICSAK